ncbi:MAG: type II toxin-antitoxin system HicA family toxin [Deltaproteobacteria bacterium]|nr:type II toxin-antitoxin system HicA family toxin [Deltaproteobacteria bacterium]
MSRLIPLKPTQIIRILHRLGFQKIRQEGSHIYLSHLDGRAAVVPMHKGEDIGKGLIKKILQDVEMTWDEFIKNR